MSWPSQLRMLPRLGFTLTESFFTLSATAIKKLRLAVMV